MTLGDIEDAVSRLNEIGRLPVRVHLTFADYARLLEQYGVESGPNVVGMWPLVSLRSLPVYYGERSEIVYSDGTVESLYNSP